MITKESKNDYLLLKVKILLIHYIYNISSYRYRKKSFYLGQDATMNLYGLSNRLQKLNYKYGFVNICIKITKQIYQDSILILIRNQYYTDVFH